MRLPIWLTGKKRVEEQARLRRLERKELQSAINNLDRTRNNIEELMRRMLEERREAQ